MADEGTPAPRRALGPLPDDPDDDLDDAPVGGRFARAISPAEPSPLTSGSGHARLALSPSSPPSPSNPLDVPGTTPVPPPAPVFPDSEAALPPASGRRFSASAEPSEFTYAAPRRSAVSATSPSSPFDSLPQTPRPTAPPAVTVAVPGARPTGPVKPTEPAGDGVPRSVPTAPSAPTALVAPAAADTPDASTDAPAGETAKSRRGRKPRPAKEPRQAKAAPPKEARPHKERSTRPAVVIIASVAAFVVLVSAVVWLLTLRSGAPSGSPSTAVTASALDPLLTSADLGTLGGQTWAESTGTSDAVRPICLPDTGNGLPEAARTVSRKIPATTSPVASVVQVVDTYADAATASTAYSVRLTQSGTCKDDISWIVGGNDVTGLADSSDAVRLVVQDQQSLFHTLLLTRTGRSLSMVDVTTPDTPVAAIDVANATRNALSRQCGGDLGTCPSNVAATAAPPPAGDPEGWLVEADLPRVTPGSGRWGATDPFTTLAITGSLCEAINLETLPGTVSAGQRTLLLADDPKAPKGFGVDMVTYLYSSDSAATSQAGKLTKSISSCPDRAPTASVVAGSNVKGTTSAGDAITGSTFVVTQKTATQTLVYRVAVLTVGSRLVYLLGNPTTGFDFTDAQWKAVAVRSGQRAAQAA